MDERLPAMRPEPGPGRTVVEYGYGGNERLVMNMGPQHPSAHGVFRMILTLEGEKVVKGPRGQLQEVRRVASQRWAMREPRVRP